MPSESGVHACAVGMPPVHSMCLEAPQQVRSVYFCFRLHMWCMGRMQLEFHLVDESLLNLLLVVNP